MARREKRITIRAMADKDGNVTPGRDEGKTYVLREMSATRAEDWAMRALLALTNAGAELPDDILNAGMAGMATMGLQALTSLRYDDVKPLMDEMFTCVEICPEPNNPNVVRALVEDDIEEVLTRGLLRKEILDLHMGFSRPGVQSTSQPETPFPVAGEITRTSPAR